MRPFANAGDQLGLIADFRSNSPKRPSLDERLEKELGIKVRGSHHHDHDSANGIPDLSRPPPGYPSKLGHIPQYPQKSSVDPPEEGRLVRVGNMLQIVPEPNIVKSKAVGTPVTPNDQLESNKAKELMRKLEEAKKKKEAERKARREQRLLELQKRQLELHDTVLEESNVKTSTRILETIEREEDHEAKVLAEAMSSIPDEDEDDHEEEAIEDIQGLSAAKRKREKKKTEIRYISLKPLSKKERKRQAKIIQNDPALLLDAQDPDPDQELEDPEDFVKPSPVPLPDAESVKSILHRFGNLDKASRRESKKVLRYADGVLPGQGSPDHHNAPQEPSPPPPSHNRYNIL